MKIATYKNLILILPVREQCFTTKRATWKKAEESFDWFKKINDKLFEGNDTLTVSRQDVFDTYYLREKIVKTIFWGYTYGMRGNNLENILKKIENIERII
jgi:hypothetical protein